MKITGVLRLDLSPFIEYQVIDTGRREPYGVWEQLERVTYPLRVVIDIGSAERVIWTHSLVKCLSQVDHVQVTGEWHAAVALSIEALQTALARFVPLEESA